MTSSSTPDMSSLTLSPQRLQEHFNDYNDHQQFHFSTSPSIIPGQSLYNPFAQQQSPPKTKTPVRSSLPTQWLENPSPVHDARSLSPPMANNNSDLSSGGGSPPLSHVPQSLGSAQDEEIIPTAIVIKNIPFNVKRETLLDIIASLAIPTPYAFNYHLDPAGAFRGLAFANFRAATDADAVVAALNGFDVQGRKLRVEYKKVLQAGEKERIEREKALRRMRSMQLEKEHLSRYDEFGPVATPAFTAGRPFAADMAVPVTGYGIAQQQQLPPQMSNMPQQPYTGPAHSYMPLPAPTSPTSKTAIPTELDLNDPSTLEIYSRILLFKDDRMRDELAFSRTLAPKERRVVHLIAQKLGLYHYSVGEGAERYAVVTRVDRDGRNVSNGPPRQPSHTLRRAPSNYVLGSTNNSMEDTVPALRAKKSMPDMKTLHAASPRLTSRLSNSNMREGYATIASSSRRPHPGFGSIFGSAGLPSSSTGVPPVPSIPNSLSNSMNGGSSMPASGADLVGSVVRQPRGPGSGSSSGFAARRERAVVSESLPRSGVGLEARSHEPLEI